MSSTQISSACSPRPMLIVPTSSSVSSPRLKLTLPARVTVNMPTSQAAQVLSQVHGQYPSQTHLLYKSLTGPPGTGVTTPSCWISRTPGTQPTSSTTARVLGPRTSPAAQTMIRSVHRLRLAWAWRGLEQVSLVSFPSPTWRPGK